MTDKLKLLTPATLTLENKSCSLPTYIGVEGEKAQKAFEKELKAHDERVIERNRMPIKAFEKMLNKVGEIKPSDCDHAIAAPEPMRIPIQLDLKINIEVCLFGKSVNISMP